MEWWKIATQYQLKENAMPDIQCRSELIYKSTRRELEDCDYVYMYSIVGG